MFDTEAVYLTHHAVLKDSTTTKLRVVFDASRKSSNGMSLNDNLLSGSKIQSDITHLMIKWRLYKYALKADIEKIYRQSLVNENHTKYQRIIWRNVADEQFQEYEMKTVTYGTACAQYLAIRVLKQLAEDERKNFPIAAEKLENEFYVDDFMSGVNNEAEAIKIMEDMKKLLATAHFNLRK